MEKIVRIIGGGLAGLTWISRRIGRDYRTRLEAGAERDRRKADRPEKVSA